MRWESLAIIWLLASTALGTDYYVGPSGRADSVGTRAAPWDIVSALDGSKKVLPGDRILLLQGTYRRRPKELFAVSLEGTTQKPITVGAAPGAWPVVDGGFLFQKEAKAVWLRDIEITVSEPDTSKDHPVEGGSFPESFKRPWGGVEVQGGDDLKFIDLVVHGCRQGMGLWKDALRAEVCGCIFYDNGWNAVDRGHGHGIYTQNEIGAKVIRNCIFTGGYGYSLHAYGSSNAFVDNYLIEGNIAYDANTFLVGGGRPSRGIVVRDNSLYGVQMRIGYDAPSNEDCTVSGNVIANGSLDIVRFSKVTQSDNLLVAKDATRPSTPLVRLRVDPYNPSRAHVAIYNWPKTSSVKIPVAGFGRAGATVSLYDPRNLREPIARVRSDGRTITVPSQSEFRAYVLVAFSR